MKETEKEKIYFEQLSKLLKAEIDKKISVPMIVSYIRELSVLLREHLQNSINDGKKPREDYRTDFDDYMESASISYLVNSNRTGNITIPDNTVFNKFSNRKGDTEKETRDLVAWYFGYAGWKGFIKGKTLKEVFGIKSSKQISLFDKRFTHKYAKREVPLKKIDLIPNEDTLTFLKGLKNRKGKPIASNEKNGNKPNNKKSSEVLSNTKKQEKNTSVNNKKSASKSNQNSNATDKKNTPDNSKSDTEGLSKNDTNSGSKLNKYFTWISIAIVVIAIIILAYSTYQGKENSPNTEISNDTIKTKRNDSLKVSSKKLDTIKNIGSIKKDTSANKLRKDSTSKFDINEQKEIIKISKKEGKYGIVDGDEKLLVPHIYDGLSILSQNSIRATKGKKYGVINKMNQTILPLEYDYISPVLTAGLHIIEKNGKEGAINKKGEIVIPLVYDGLDGLFNYSSYYIIARKNGKSGIINNQNKIVLPFEYESLSSSYFKVISARKEGKFGAINIKGEILIPFEYDFVSSSPTLGLYEIKKGEKYGLFNRKGQVLVPIIYDDIKIHGASDIAVIKDGKHGIINQYGKSIIEPLYDRTICFCSGDPSKAIVAINKKHGLIDEKGNVIIDMKYDYIYDFYRMDAGVPYPENPEKKTNTTIAILNKKYGIIDKKDNVIIPFIYDGFKFSSSVNTLIVKKEDKWGLININSHNIMIPFEYSKLESNYPNFKVEKDGKSFIIDKNNKCVENCD